MVYYPVGVEESVKRECKRGKYSGRTAKTYVYCTRRFLKFAGKSLDKISKKDVRLFLDDLSEKERPETTFTYLHTAAPNMIKIRSPLDRL